MHYHRQYRHGSTDAHAPTSGLTASHGRRYKRIYRPNHPLANKNGALYTHRAVLYDTIGPGPHPCHWCTEPINWLPRGADGAIEVDHLNDIGDDNRPENLVPSCGPCNTGRAGHRRHQALRTAGYWSEHDTVAQLRNADRQRKTTGRYTE
jgi:hypothetical protein